MKLKYELVLGDPNNNLLNISIRDDDKEKSVEMCLHEVDPLQNANGKSKVDHHCIRHIERWFERKIDPVLCKGDLDQRSRTHKRTSRIPQNLNDGVIDEDFHLTQCALRYVPQKTIQLNSMIMERSAKFWKTHTRNPEQIPLLGYPESRPYSFNHEV